MNQSSMWFLTEDKLLWPTQNKLDKNKEILALIWYSNQLVVNKISLNKPHYQLSKVFSKATMVPFLHMVKLVQVKHIPWREVKQSKNIEVSFQERFNMLSNQSKVIVSLISGTPGVNFMVQVSML